MTEKTTMVTCADKIVISAYEIVFHISVNNFEEHRSVCYNYNLRVFDFV